MRRTKTIPTPGLIWMLVVALCPLSQGVTLVVESEQGGAVPPVGTNVFFPNTRLSCHVDNSPIEIGSTQYVCMGWIGTGNVPESGQDTVVPSFRIRTNSTITWLWQTNVLTNVWLSVSNSTPERGAVFGGNQWVQQDSTQRVDVVHFQDYHFSGWSGDVPASNTMDRPLWLTMDGPKNIAATFAFNTTTNGTALPPRVEFLPLPTLTNFSLAFSDLHLDGGVEKNLSGCTIEAETGYLLGIVNNGTTSPYYPTVQFYEADGTFISKINLQGFLDTESICHYRPESNLYAIVEEGVGDIAIVELTTNMTSISKNDAIEVISTGFDGFGNSGWEGITYDRANHCFYLVKERIPMGLIRVTWTTNAVYIDEPFDAASVLAGTCTDLSDLVYDHATGHLLLLSDESGKIIECSLQGNILHSLDIPGKQVEGLYMTADRRTLHVVGEDTEYYRYELQSAGSTGPEGTAFMPQLQLSWASTNSVAVDYCIQSTNAIAETDFTPATGLVVFTIGTMTTNFIIQVPYDGTGEGDEHLVVTLTNATGGSAGRGDSFLYTIEANSSADPTTDADDDGLPDTWEETYFGSTNAANGGPQDDWDDDSVVNADEYAAGTNPTNAASRLVLVHADRAGNGNTIWWQSVTNRTYALHRSTNLESGWEVDPVVSALPGDLSGTNSVTDSSSLAPNAFYRIAVDSQP